MQISYNPETSSKSLIRGTTIVSVLTLISRILGFLRDMVIARLFGAGMIADAFFVAFRIPNILRSFVAEGAFTSAFVPMFSTEVKHSQARAQETLSAVSGLLITTTMALATLGILFAPEITNIFAPGFGIGTEKSQLCIWLMRLMFPYIICISLVAMINGALNTVKIFGMAAVGQIVMNGVLIVAAIIAEFFDNTSAATLLSVSVVLGGITQISVLLPTLKKAGFVIIPSRHIFKPVIKDLLKLMLPATIGAGAYQIAIFVNTLLASLLQEGSVSWLFYADRLAQVPIGLFTVALASVLLPTLSHLEAEKDQSQFNQSLINALRYTSFFIIPIAFGLFFFAEPLITIMFERGAFTHNSSINTALALQALCIGLWGISCHSMTVRALLAKKDTVSPTIIGLVSLFINITLSLLFMGSPRSGQQGVFYQVVLSIQDVFPAGMRMNLGHAGLALASGLASSVSFLILATVFHKKSGNVVWDQFLSSTIKALTAGLMMWLVLDTCIVLIPGQIMQLVVGIPTGMLLFLLGCWILGSTELKEISTLVFRKLNRNFPNSGK